MERWQWDKTYQLVTNSLSNSLFNSLCILQYLISLPYLSTGQSSEWALLRRHSSEDVFGVQIAGNQANHLATVARMLERETDTDFVDLNCGCPIDLVCSRGIISNSFIYYLDLISNIYI